MPTFDRQAVLRVIVRCRDLKHDGLSSGARHALVVLASYYPNIWPTQERLATNLGTSRRTVNRWLRELEDAGLIVRKRGRQQYATHYLLDSSLLPRKRVDRGPGVGAPGDPGVDDPDYEF